MLRHHDYTIPQSFVLPLSTQHTREQLDVPSSGGGGTQEAREGYLVDIQKNLWPAKF